MTDPLVVMSWGGGWGRALATCVSAPFTRATGIPVEHVQHVGLALPERLGEAIARGLRPPFDVVWSNAVPALRVAARGGCVTLDAPNLACLGERAAVHPALAIPYVVHYVLVHRDGEPPPASYRELFEPRHRGKVALYPGGNGFHAIAQVLGGGTLAQIPDDMRACWSVVERLAPQLGSLDYSIGMGPRLARGELALAHRALPNALAFRADGIAIDWVVPREGVTDTLDALWIPRGVPSSAAARAQHYIDFALSRPIQDSWCRALGVLPTHREARVPPPFGTRGLPASVDDRANVLAIEDAVKAAHEPAWETRFDRLVSCERDVTR